MISQNECIEEFKDLKKKYPKPDFSCPDWDLPFEIMYDASDYVVGAVLGQRKTKHFQPIHYASKTMMDDQCHYTQRRSRVISRDVSFSRNSGAYLVYQRTPCVYETHSALSYLLPSKMLSRDCSGGFSYSKNLMSLFVIKKGAENLAADHLSRLENPQEGALEKKENQ
ncbi:reverse transcriptase domain-containing protein [Tanacetum coccineum]